MVELAERLVAGWAVFGKNGSDVINWTVRVAHRHTGRRKILRLRGAYQGLGPWCAFGYGGYTEEEGAHFHEFPWNDLEGFRELVGRHGDDLAGVLITPYRHPGFEDSRWPESGFLQAIQRACNECGIVLILDDICAGFRLDLGGSYRAFGFEPDISCFCKALGNGHPISAAVGRQELKIAASKVFVAGSYWYSAVPMAADADTRGGCR